MDGMPWESSPVNRASGPPRLDTEHSESLAPTLLPANDAHPAGGAVVEECRLRQRAVGRLDLSAPGGHDLPWFRGRLDRAGGYIKRRTSGCARVSGQPGGFTTGKQIVGGQPASQIGVPACQGGRTRLPFPHHPVVWTDGPPVLASSSLLLSGPAGSQRPGTSSSKAFRKLGRVQWT